MAILHGICSWIRLLTSAVSICTVITTVLTTWLVVVAVIEKLSLVLRCGSDCDAVVGMAVITICHVVSALVNVCPKTKWPPTPCDIHFIATSFPLSHMDLTLPTKSCQYGRSLAAFTIYLRLLLSDTINQFLNITTATSVSFRTSHTELLRLEGYCEGGRMVCEG